eukprot:CAMPEP_0206452294 /NCGR_PEP_ID=MMETSP0324_2-20121206/19864_1 /ASSEMBLY_ACC=CAM_ASM_000836 /TAXON_ID=2866 /ORGANISM="Crypthecodinium cohnii, Strain Seligo" /LENGTH=149 /DNA_ID=CAMNT_0053922365 /DNA_START=62 /DNA_END=511 /DNA_ORIENTATION=+
MPHQGDHPACPLESTQPMQIGDRVRVRPGTSTRSNQGFVSAGRVGTVRSLENNLVRVDFGQCGSWSGSLEELEIVRGAVPWISQLLWRSLQCLLTIVFGLLVANYPADELIIDHENNIESEDVLATPAGGICPPTQNLLRQKGSQSSQS